ARRGQALLGDHALGVERVAREERMREGDVAETQLSDQRPLRQLSDRRAHHGGERPHGVHQTLPEGLLLRCEGGVQMER
ncbi:hypothetical protein ABE10_02605, partial [Bacillus toyonensis]|nr:hypothetical protein [Bacillus toyonensis]